MILDYIAYGFVGAAALAALAWALYLIYDLRQSDLGRGILLLLAVAAFIGGTILSVIWLAARKIT